MADGDYIILNRKILKWKWYKNSNTKDVFIHCLLNANWEDTNYEGIEIPRGSFITTVKKLSTELNFSVKEIRTALNHLIRTNELAIKTTPQHSIITVINYDQYQLRGKGSDNQGANEGQTKGKRRANTQEEGMNREEENGEEKGTKEERERTKEKEESGLKVEGREVEKSKEVEGKRREEGIKEKESKKESPPKPEKMVDMFKRISVDYTLSDVLYDKLIEWFTYKQERKEIYKETGMRGLLKRVVKNSHEYGDIEVCDLIDDSIASNWQGIIWDNIGKPRGRKSLAERWRDA